MTRRDFLADQIAALQPFDFFVVAPSATAVGAVEVAREQAGGLSVVVLRADAASGTPEPPTPTADAGAAADLADKLLREALAADEAAALDVRHGSRRAEHEARQKLAVLRAKVEPVLTAMLGHAPHADNDGDFLFDHESTQVYVAPRAGPGAPPIVRVFAITNVGVNLTPELGLFLSRLNFSLAFGRFALDVEHQAVWFDETLLGEHVTDEELRFTIDVVAQTADEWDDRIQQMFGGTTPRSAGVPAVASADPPAKPGQGGYL
jgi:hypothetical protein